MSLENEWEQRLTRLGMPAEPIPEEEKATEGNIELISTEMMDPEAETIARKLKEEDPRNVLGGFPNSISTIISIINDIQNEVGKKARLFIHSSCINGHDCITLSHPDGKVYHYNTKNIDGYSRENMISQLEVRNIPFIEK